MLPKCVAPIGITVKIKNIINTTVKNREDFRPFAPAILEEKTKEYFENVQTSYFMENTLVKVRIIK